MPRVTRIEAQQHNANRYSIFIDGDYALSLSANDLLDTGIHQDQELSDQQIEQLKRQSDEGKAYDKAINYLSFRRRSRNEIEKYLLSKGYEEPAVSSTIERLEQQKLIDDAQFADSWVRDRQNLRPRSRRQLAMELRAKGLDDEVITGRLEELGEEGELEAIRAVISKKAARLSSERLTQYLLQRGYKYDLVKKALSED
jgi:regulatory protein